MLPAAQRLKRPAEFGAAIRQGVRVATPTVVVHLRLTGVQDPPVSRVGFVVSKKVGNAVVRNRVKRQLRHLVAGVPLPDGIDVVVRALPGAASAQSLRPDVEVALLRALHKVQSC